MSFQFATCERNRALGFIKQMYPNRELSDTPESLGPLLDLVQKDVVRVQDPDFHRPCQVVAGTHWDEMHRDAVLAACSALTK